MLREDEDWLQNIAGDMEPEDDCLTVHGTDGFSTSVFTPLGIERLPELIPDYKRKLTRRGAHLMDTAPRCR